MFLSAESSAVLCQAIICIKYFFSFKQNPIANETIL